MISSKRISGLERSRPLTFLSVIVAAATGILVSSAPANAQSRLDVLHAFSSQGALNPAVALIQGTDGNFYGITSGGGSSEPMSIVPGPDMSKISRS